MSREVYRYRLESSASLQEVEESLLLAVLAVESIHGRSRVHLDASFHLDKTTRTCEVDATTDVGRDIARIFTGYLAREFGEEAFRVERTTVGTAEGKGRTIDECA